MRTNGSRIMFFILMLAAMPLAGSAQVNPRFPLSPSQIVPPPVETAQFPDIGRRSMMGTNGLRSANVQNGGGGNRHFDGTGDLRRDRINTNAPDLNTIPFWSDSFDYQGLTFRYSMVGTDPKRGSATTVIPTVLIPVRFVFADGTVFDPSTDLVNGQTPIQGIMNSPLFQNYEFTPGGVNVGNTQYGDAFQRANFWSSVSTRSPNYHVLLSQPTVMPVWTVNVPADKGSSYFDPYSGITIPLVDYTLYYEQMYAALQNVSPRSLPIVVSGVVWPDNGTPGTVSGYGKHGAVRTGRNVQTYINTTYGRGEFGLTQDVVPLSHEIIEWLNDPFINNFTPGWLYPYLEPVELCDSDFTYDLLEVADPFEIFGGLQNVAIQMPSSTYHVVEGMFIDFYLRRNRSRSVNGQYSFFEIGAPYGLFTAPSPPCTGSVQVDHVDIDVPGARFTSAQGVNNQGDAVGYYMDQQNSLHGFKWRNGQLWTMNYPGSVGTVPSKINDSGDVVGYFYDLNGLPHGFVYHKGRWSQIDFPGSTDTQALGINSAGDIVGVYDSTQPVTHGFTLRNGRFARVDTVFGSQSALTGINDMGQQTGFAWDDGVNGPYLGVVGRSDRFSTLNMPTAPFTLLYGLNNNGMIVGLFNGSTEIFSGGLVQIFGNLHVTRAGLNPNIYTFANNDSNQVAGQFYDFTKSRWVGFVGTLPIANQE